MMSDKDSSAVQEWKWSAIEEQQSYMELLKGRKTDAVASSQLSRVVGFAMFGPPAQLPDATNQHTGYDSVQLKHVGKVCKAILRRGNDEEDPKEVHLKFVFVVTRASRQRTATYPVFHLQDGGHYIDWQARVYGSWKQFLKRNKLPRCRMCYPEGGAYSASEYGAVLVGFRRSPASNNVHTTLAVTSLVVSLASTAVSLASLVVAVSPPVLVAAAVGAVVSGTYSVANSVASLNDRRQHGKTLSPRSGDARRCWLALIAGTAGLAVSGTGPVAARGLAVLTATTAAARGLSLANSAVDLMKKMWAGQTLTALDAFQIASFLLFFTGTALSSAQAASRLRSARPADKNNVQPKPRPKSPETHHAIPDKPRADGYVRVDRQQLNNDAPAANGKAEEFPDDEVDAMLQLLREEEKGKQYVVDYDADMNTFWKRVGTVIIVSSVMTIIVIARTLLAQ
ncbi:hypothetical protein PR048_009292 [Dryococelus australis]|uniref:DUF4781 domain-containing protein n=1 Tax=Dryococelus australis TaxID=614101 RepID=A0ABQ9HZK2_9NEOP|nr:hypothetical protein PR048_009292 [Dryococelus australis]